MFSCEFWEMCVYIYFEEHLQTAASDGIGKTIREMAENSEPQLDMIRSHFSGSNLQKTMQNLSKSAYI